MRRNYLIIYIVLTWLVVRSKNINAQNNEPEKELRWAIGINASPDLVSMFNTQNSTSYGGYYGGNYTYKPKLGYTCGININYMFNRLAGLEFGLQYANMGFKSQWVSNFSAIVPAGNIVKEVDKANLNFLYVPIKVNFFIGKGRLRYIGSVGAAFGLNYSEADITTTTYINGQTTRNREVYPSNPLDEFIFAQISSGLVYLANNRFTFRAEPTFRLGVFDVMGGGFGQSGLWSAGILFGGYYHF